MAAAHDAELESTLRCMQTAAAIGDWDEFSRYVDVKALRSSLKKATDEAIASAPRENVIDELNALFFGVMIDKAVDEYLTEENLPRLMRFFSLALNSSGKPPEAPPDIRRYGYFSGSDYYVLATESEAANAAEYFVFKKSPDKGWRLAGLTDQKP